MEVVASNRNNFYSELMRYLMQMVGSDQQSCGADTVQFTVGSTWMFIHQNVQDEVWG
jgi:hypothetical protein